MNGEEIISDKPVNMMARYYADPNLLAARQSTGIAQGFAAWVVDRLNLAPKLTVLDAGAGVGRFTKLVLPRLDHGARLVATDLREEMVSALRELTAPEGVSYRVYQHDLNKPIELPDKFDLILANHVLYHLDDIDRALRYLRSALRAGGRLVATTNADTLPVPILSLHDEVSCRVEEASQVAPIDERRVGQTFNAETGSLLLARHFTRVQVEFYGHCLPAQTPEKLVASYRDTGRFRDICEIVGEDAAVQVALNIAHEWEAADDPRQQGVSVMAMMIADNPAD